MYWCPFYHDFFAASIYSFASSGLAFTHLSDVFSPNQPDVVICSFNVKNKSSKLSPFPEM